MLNGSSRLRLEYDSTNIAQFAWDVLFRRFADWGEIQTPDKLMAVLLKIGTNHIRDQLRRFDHEHGGWRQVPLDDERAQAAMPIVAARPTMRWPCETAWRPSCCAVRRSTARSWTSASRVTPAGGSRGSSGQGADKCGGC